MNLTASDLKRRLNEQALGVAQYLLPGGKQSGSEWQVGSVGGEKGQSLNVHIGADAKAGKWKDFATGEGGDLIDLWQAVRGIDLKTALEEVKSYLGIRESAEPHRAKRKSFSPPEKPKGLRAPNDESPVMKYLRSRGLTKETIKAFKVGESGCAIVLPFIDEDGNPVLLKNMLIDITANAIARDENGKRKIWTSKNSQPCLFGWQTIDGNARSVTITEGEFDAMAGWQIGKLCLSVPFGGGTGDKQEWIEYEYDKLARFDRIYLALDNDSEGRAATNEIAKRLGLDRCFIVSLPHKDMNECLNNGAFEEVEQAYLNAKTINPERLVSALEARNRVHDYFENGEDQSGLELPWDKYRENIRFRKSEVTIWSGYSGHGKSELLGFLALWGVKQGERFCIGSFEMPIHVTLARMIRQAAQMASPTRGYRDALLDEFGPEVWLYDRVGEANIDEVLEVFRYTAKRYGVTHFIIDSLVKLGIGEEDYDAQKKVLDKLTSFAHEFDVHCHMVAHSRKGDEERPPRKLDVKGGGVITDQADNVVVVWRNKPREVEKKKIEAGELTGEPRHQDKGGVYMQVEKQRANGKEGRMHLYHMEGCGAYTASENWKMPDYVKYHGERMEVK